MAIFRCSMFGHLVYDDKLTYQELLDTEARVTAIMQSALEECGAQHIDFTPQADSLLMECLFPEVDRDTNHSLCDAVIRQLGPGVLARFVFMDRQMDSVAFYFLGRGKWQEQVLSVPRPRQALSGWIVRQERKAAASDARALRTPETPGPAEAAGTAEAAAPAQNPAGEAPKRPIGPRSGSKKRKA